MLTGASAVTATFLGGPGGADHREFTCQVEPTRPETTLARSRCVARRAWDGFAVEATSAVLPTGNRTHFHITIDLEVRVNGAHHFNKRWAKTIERKLL